jgi:hypothetical protein
MRPHWENCITHLDERLIAFIDEYFRQAGRQCLIVGGAGFDPRARRIPDLLGAALGSALHAFMIREERGNPAANLQERADANEAHLRSSIANCVVESIHIFAEDDDAPVGGPRLVSALRKYAMPAGLTDIVLDMSALSIGIAFPAARMLLAISEADPNVSFHVMITTDPDLDSRITGEPDDRVVSIKGFSGLLSASDLPTARIWLPQLAHGRGGALNRIRGSLSDVYGTCPMLPFPAANPRRADELITEFGSQLRADWEVDPRDLIYVSERNPLDSYRTISTLKQRYDQTVADVYDPQLVLSPVGSKVMAVGGMMAAIEHNLLVSYVETVRYDFASSESQSTAAPDSMVHVWLDGPIYGGLGCTAAPAPQEAAEPTHSPDEGASIREASVPQHGDDIRREAEDPA